MRSTCIIFIQSKSLIKKILAFTAIVSNQSSPRLHLKRKLAREEEDFIFHSCRLAPARRQAINWHTNQPTCEKAKPLSTSCKVKVLFSLLSFLFVFRRTKGKKKKENAWQKKRRGLQASLLSSCLAFLFTFCNNISMSPISSLSLLRLSLSLLLLSQLASRFL